LVGRKRHLTICTSGRRKLRAAVELKSRSIISWLILQEKATADIFERVIEMPRNTCVVLYILVLIAVIVSVDLLFFKNRFWERLIVNIGIVLVFAAFYLRFLKNP